ncbi:hypothetical protein [Natranaerofaba carboxydovora]|uniref:hypothetical protein n=1 Tax=Natranaerofaba carboxydovora TaxID=2742683 RepID=UPI001F12D43C|nr:hypothetical protein [Natranaerofaba carboxydovora]UMZ74269.1 hypothetical protein ACONDI_01856 [Natranaerofaba carboxydovora]
MYDKNKGINANKIFPVVFLILLVIGWSIYSFGGSNNQSSIDIDDKELIDEKGFEEPGQKEPGQKEPGQKENSTEGGQGGGYSVGEESEKEIYKEEVDEDKEPEKERSEKELDEDEFQRRVEEMLPDFDFGERTQPEPGFEPGIEFDWPNTKEEDTDDGEVAPGIEMPEKPEPPEMPGEN